jgi:hypothetical protein
MQHPPIEFGKRKAQMKKELELRKEAALLFDIDFEKRKVQARQSPVFQTVTRRDLEVV